MIPKPTAQQILLLQRLDALHSRAELQDRIGRRDAAKALRDEAAEVVDQLLDSGIDPLDHPL